MKIIHNLSASPHKNNSDWSYAALTSLIFKITENRDSHFSIIEAVSVPLKEIVDVAFFCLYFYWKYFNSKYAVDRHV